LHDKNADLAAFMKKKLRKKSRKSEHITYLIIRNMPNEALEISLEIYNDIEQECSQTSGKNTVFFIPKRDKTNVRPISMTSFV
jgi:hypothetical protein